MTKSTGCDDITGHMIKNTAHCITPVNLWGQIKDRITLVPKSHDRSVQSPPWQRTWTPLDGIQSQIISAVWNTSWCMLYSIGSCGTRHPIVPLTSQSWHFIILHMLLWWGCSLCNNDPQMIYHCGGEPDFNVMANKAMANSRICPRLQNFIEPFFGQWCKATQTLYKLHTEFMS